MTKRQNNNLSTVLRRVKEVLGDLSNEELQRLSDPAYTLQIRAVRKQTQKEPSAIVAEDVVKEVITMLTGQSSRQEAQAFLNINYSSKKALEVIARHLDIPITRQDKVENLRDKIVEATVGARIRSQAIQGQLG